MNNDRERADDGSTARLGAFFISEVNIAAEIKAQLRVESYTLTGLRELKVFLEGAPDAMLWRPSVRGDAPQVNGHLSGELTFGDREFTVTLDVSGSLDDGLEVVVAIVKTDELPSASTSIGRVRISVLTDDDECELVPSHGSVLWRWTGRLSSNSVPTGLRFDRG